MAVILNHMVAPAHEQRSLGTSGHLAPVRVNETPTLDFNDAAHFDVYHYAFHHVSDEEFDAILRSVQEAEIAFGSDP